MAQALTGAGVSEKEALAVQPSSAVAVPYVALCMYAVPGRQGVAIASESLTSWTAPQEVRAVFVVDAGQRPREQVRDALSTVLSRRATAPGRPPLVASEYISIPSCDAAEACMAMARRAQAAGATHGLFARSHEWLQRQEDGQVCETLPHGWEAMDVVQFPCNLGHCPQRDALVRLDRFTFVGPRLAAPVPLRPPSRRHPLRACGAVGFAIIADTELVTPQQAADDVQRTATALTARMMALRRHGQEDTDATKMEHVALEYLRLQFVFVLATAQQWGRVATCLTERIRRGDAGWGGREGTYVAMWLRTRWCRRLVSEWYSELYLAASAGLSLPRPRFEALTDLCQTMYRDADTDAHGDEAAAAGGFEYARSGGASASACAGAGAGAAQTQAHPLATLTLCLLTGAMGGVRRAVTSPWLGDSDATSREIWSLAVRLGAEARGGDIAATFSRACAIVATRAVHARDSKSLRSYFPDVSALWLPRAVLYDDVVVDLEAARASVAETARTMRFGWLLHILKQALHVPCALAWSVPPSVVQDGGAVKETLLSSPSCEFAVYISLGPSTTVATTPAESVPVIAQEGDVTVPLPAGRLFATRAYRSELRCHAGTVAVVVAVVKLEGM